MQTPLRIVLAEDNPLDAELVVRQLSKDGVRHEFIRVASEESFVAALAREPDVILSDYDMGSFTGFRALEILRERKIDIPLILVSGTIGEDLAVEAIKLGASDYLLKDRMGRLASAIMQAVSDGRLRRERRQAEVALALSEERYRLLVEQAADGIFIVGTDGLFADINARGLEMIHHTRERCLRLRFADLIADADRGRLNEEFARLKQGEILVAEFEVLRGDGRRFDAEISARALPDGKLMGIVRDLTERRRAEQALRESEERFRQLAENINEVFWMTDPAKAEILYVSPAYETIWGRTCESLYRRDPDWIDSVHADDRERVAAAARQQPSGGYVETYRIVRPDGAARWIRDRAYPIRDAAGRVYRIVGTAEDITETRKLEEQFRHAQKMEAIGTLAGGIAHDFNNILCGIIGYVELAKTVIKEDSRALQYLELVLQGSNRAAGLVRQILAFSRQQEHKRAPLQLSLVVTEAVKLLRATLPAMIEFDVSLGRDLPPVMADPTQIHQVVMNLCTNASHAMRDRPGRLGVRLERVLVDASWPDYASRIKPGLYVRLSVSDTGCGIEEAVLARIFEPFFTTKKPGEGTGLGLSVVHGIMEAHEGTITVQSHPGEGTVFHLYFPADGTAVVAGSAKEKDETPRGDGQRILFVEDEEVLAQLGHSMLKAQGYNPTVTTNPVRALEMFRDNPAGFDLVITDHSMPGMVDTALAEELLRLRPDLPIILTTGYTPKLNAESVKASGIRELLMKPFTFRSMGKIVRDVLSTGSRPDAS